MADQHYVLIRREVPPTRRVEFVSVDLVSRAQQQRERGGPRARAARPDLRVRSRDRSRSADAAAAARAASAVDARCADREVSVGGRVNAPGQYPLEPGMRVSDLIRAGGSLNEAAYGGKAELTRNAIDGGEVRQTELIEIDLAKAMAGDPAGDIELQPVRPADRQGAAAVGRAGIRGSAGRSALPRPLPDPARRDAQVRRAARRRYDRAGVRAGRRVHARDPERSRARVRSTSSRSGCRWISRRCR